MPMPKKPDPVKHCDQCGKQLVRKRFKSGVLESCLHFRRRKFCNVKCFGKSIEKERSDGSPSSARTMGRSQKPKGKCERCGRPDARDVHHKDGDCRNNRKSNLERICRSCHNKIHRPRGSCVICGKPQKGLGYCDTHYQRFKKWGDPLAIKDNQFVPVRREGEANKAKGCKVKGCKRPHHALGYCGMHRQQKRRGKLKENMA